MRHIPLTLTLLAVLSIAAMTVAAVPNVGSGMQNHMNMSMPGSCLVAGADVKFADVDNGIAVTITTKTEDVAELRRRVENMAKMHNGDSNSESNSKMHGGMMPFTVKYEEVAEGARLTLTPKDPAQLESFRTMVRQRAEHMKTGDCSMIQGMMGGMTGGMIDEHDHGSHP